MNSTSTPAADEHAYTRVEVSHAASSIRQLHEQVCSHVKRVEITREDCDDCCVLISQNELHQLEQTIEILAGTEAFQHLCADIQQLLRAADVVYYPPG
jgi:PHD/YefM family antitoxin component YafN of YafNO toxin-antitoxin module